MGPPSGGGGGTFDPLGSVAGLGLTGTYIFNALAGGNVDAVEFEGDTLDVCYSHPSPTSDLHYHFLGPCAKKGYGYWNDSESPPLCRGFDDCTATPGPFSLAAPTYE